MKKIALIFLLFSCTTYQSFIQVNDFDSIPNGSKEIIVLGPIEYFLDVLKENTIHYYESGNGIVTDEILLDEGTRAQYKVYEMKSQIKIVPYWGITQKVINEAQLWGGYETTAFMSKDMERVIYNSSKKRPKKVFDYGIMLASQAGQYEVN